MWWCDGEMMVAAGTDMCVCERVGLSSPPSLSPLLSLLSSAYTHIHTHRQVHTRGRRAPEGTRHILY